MSKEISHLRSLLAHKDAQVSKLHGESQKKSVQLTQMAQRIHFLEQVIADEAEKREDSERSFKA
jgi:hypothetical protein